MLLRGLRLNTFSNFAVSSRTIIGETGFQKHLFIYFTMSVRYEGYTVILMVGNYHCDCAKE